MKSVILLTPSKPGSQGSFVSKQSLGQLYSSKTDDELLILCADSASLREEAKSALADELRRRNLDADPLEVEGSPIRGGTSLSKPRFLRAISFAGILILNTCIAVFGAGLPETEIAGMFHPHTIAGVLWNVWSLSLWGSAIIGFFMWRTWKTEATKWTWVLPALWFGLRVMTARGTGGIWSNSSGVDCASGVRSSGCANFFAFTVPFVRGIAYSTEACFSSLLSHQMPQSPVHAVDRDAHVVER